MKICQLCAIDWTMARLLLPLCVAMREAGHEVVAICSDGPMLERVAAAGIRCRPAAIARSADPLKALASSRAVARIMREEAFDMVHVHTPVASLVGRLAAWRCGVPLIAYTAHGFYFHERMAWAPRVAFAALEWLAGRVTHVLMTENREDAAFARTWGLVRGGGRIEVIGNGVDPDRFGPGTPQRRAALRTALATPQDAVVIAVVARLVAEKGYPELLRAMEKVDAHLWIAGSRLDSERARAIDDALAAVAADEDLRRRVHLLGERDDVPELLAAADLFVLPSHREGMPRSIIEAMMTGLAVVATDIRGSRELVEDGVTGRLVPVGDGPALAVALAELAGDADRRQTFGAAGRARALACHDERRIHDRQLEILGLARSRLA